MKKCVLCGARPVPRIARRTGKPFDACPNWSSSDPDHKIKYFEDDIVEEKAVDNAWFSKLILSPEQEDFRDAVINSKRSISLLARAGTGKTTTMLISLFAQIDASIRAALVCFSKQNMLDNQTKAPSSTKVCTTHSLALSDNLVPLIRSATGVKPDVNSNKVSDIMSARLEELKGELSDEEIEYLHDNKGNISKVVSLIKDTLGNNSRPYIEYIIEEYNVNNETDKEELSDLFIYSVQYCFTESLLDIKRVDFSDMLYFCAVGYFKRNDEGEIEVKEIECVKFDLLLIDEDQDLTPCQIRFMQKSLAKNGRVICAGDDYQSIYAFRGVASNAIEMLTKMFDCVTMPLTVTRRCSKAAVRAVNREFPHLNFTAHPDNNEGCEETISVNKMIETVKAGDMVICRNNAPLVKHCFSIIKSGTPAFIEGREIGSALFTLASKIYKKGKCKDIDELVRYINVYSESEMNRLTRRGEPEKMEYLSDQLNMIVALTDNEEITTIDSLKSLIERLFSDSKNVEENKKKVRLTSAHKSKGLEGNNVYILLEIPMPSPKATKKKQIEQEKHLRYVAMTRTKDGLYWVG